MHACERAGRACPVHQLTTDRVRDHYIVIILASYHKRDLKLIGAQTQRIMLEAPCMTCKPLDDQPQAVIGLAALAGEKYADQAKRYIQTLYGTAEDKT